MTAHVEHAGIDRRQFFITTAAVGGALVVGFGWPRRADAVDVTTPAAPQLFQALYSLRWSKQKSNSFFHVMTARGAFMALRSAI